MGQMMDKSAYEKLIKEDIAWIDKIMAEHSPDSLEGRHLRNIAICSCCFQYGETIEGMCPNPFCRYNKKEKIQIFTDTTDKKKETLKEVIERYPAPTPDELKKMTQEIIVRGKKYEKLKKQNNER